MAQQLHSRESATLPSAEPISLMKLKLWGKLYNPSKRIFTGPWHLDKNALEELNIIVNSANEQLKLTRDAILDQKAKEAFENGSYKSFEEARYQKENFSSDIIRKDITLYSKDESRLKDDSIKQLLVDPKINNIRPKELSVDIEHGRLNAFSLNIKQRFDGELVYSIKSTNSEVEDELNYQIENWVDQYKPNSVQSFWLKFSLPMAMFSGIVFILFAINIYSTYRPSTIEVYKDQIETIIAKGVSPENQTEAIDLLLKINSNYVPIKIKEVTKVNATAKRVSIIALIFCLIGIFKPPTLIGVGKHKKLLKVYKYYMRLVLVIIPGVFLYPVIISFIKSLI